MIFDRPPAAEFEDWDAASHHVSDVYFPHRLLPRSRSSASSVLADGVELGPITIARIGWGAEVAVESHHPGAYAVNVPLSGYLESVTCGREVVACPGKGAIYPPDTATAISTWSESCAIIGVRLDRAYLQCEMTRILDRTDYRLPAQIDVNAEPGRDWLRLVCSLSQQISVGSALFTHELVTQQLAGAIAAAFVLSTVSEESVRPAARPRTVKRVIDEVEGDPSRPWTAADMAEVAGVSVRRLQEGFREHVGMSPRQYLSDVRLRRVHDELTASTDATVTELALKWGFTHTSRFAAAYRRKYGRAPSDSLRT